MSWDNWSTISYVRTYKPTFRLHNITDITYTRITLYLYYIIMAFKKTSVCQLCGTAAFSSAPRTLFATFPICLLCNSNNCIIVGVFFRAIFSHAPWQIEFPQGEVDKYNNVTTAAQKHVVHHRIICHQSDKQKIK